MKDYKKILEGVVDIINITEKSDIGFTNICTYIGENCPELVESEDEMVRKELIDFVNSRLAGFPQCEKFIAWLEKQKERNTNTHLPSFDEAQGTPIIKQEEHKPIDNVEPKFHKGDWVVYNNDICQIVKREEGCNKLVTVFGIEKEPVNERNLSTARLWTIQDAKDGDVLASKYGDDILIFRNVENNVGFSSYYNIARKGERCWLKSSFIPATKEQRDTLMKAMADAGYEWYAEKKELKKIEQKSVKWGEEDEQVIEDAETWLDTLCDYLKDSSSECIPTVKEVISKLKSLRPQLHWKPSENELEVLRLVAEKDGTCLMGLYEKLKAYSYGNNQSTREDIH